MTILSREKQFAFVHLHKCGGTSVEQSYGKVAHWSDVILGSTETGQRIDAYYRAKFSLSKHSPVMEIVAAVGPEVFCNWKVFALRRNPFRVYESFYGWIQGIFGYHARNSQMEVNDLKQLISSGDERGASFHFSNWGSAIAFANSANFAEFTRLCLDNSYLPQQSMTSRLALDTEFEPDVLVDLENIDQLWRALEAHIGRPLDRLHSNAHRRQRTFRWEPDSVQRVSELFAEDIARFGYKPPPAVN